MNSDVLFGGYYSFVEGKIDEKTLCALVATGLLLAACGVYELAPKENDPIPTIDTLPATAAVLPTAPGASAAAPQALSLEMLANAAYHSSVLAPDLANFQLEGGMFYLPHLPEESDSAYYMGLTDRAAFGDLNADGIEDAAVILHGQNGGTGHYINELAAVVNENGAAHNIATVSLGDRVEVRAVTIAEGEIIVEMVSAEVGAGAPQEKRLVYRLDGAELVN